jgi:hypothetical protein
LRVRVRVVDVYAYLFWISPAPIDVPRCIS